MAMHSVWRGIRILLAALPLVLPFEAQALYLSVSGGAVLAEDGDFSLSAGPLDLALETSFDSGFGGTAALGLDTIPLSGLSLELEAGYRQSPLSEIRVAGLDPLGDPGDLDVFTGMVNLMWEPPLPLPLGPYIGAGVGIAAMDFSLDLGSLGLGSGGRFEETAYAFAYQFMAGISFSPLPLTTLFTGYRYLATEEPELDVEGLTLTADYSAHVFEAGLRFGF